MRRYLLVAVTAAVTLTGFAAAGGVPAGAAAPGTRAVPGAQLWVARYDGGAKSEDHANAMAVSPDGRRVFVTGESYGGVVTGRDYATVAYSAATGRRLWVSRYSGPWKNDDAPLAVAVSPDGSRVFVTGAARGWGAYYDYATVAYDAVTGRQLWVSRYNDPGNGDDFGNSVAVSPDGSTVFVTGQSGDDYATVAYSAVTGRQLWVGRYNGPANGIDYGNAVAVSPGGTTVYVTGQSDGRRTGLDDYATVAYSAATGRQLWVSRYNGPGNGGDDAWSVAVSPGGGRVFVTGDSDGGRATDFDYATVAYSAVTGRQLWVRRYNGPANGIDYGKAVAVSPGGTTVYVTGQSDGRPADPSRDYATVAYSAAAGRQLWVSRYNGPANADDGAGSVAVSPGGATVFVTGYSDGGRATGDDYATVAYSAVTGRQLWVRRYNGPANGIDFAATVAVSPVGGRVFVTGGSSGRATGDDYATVAYRG